MMRPRSDAAVAPVAPHPDLDALLRHADRERAAEVAGGVAAPATATDAEVAAHVAGCAECRAAVARAARVTAALDLAGEPPPDLLARVRARRAAGDVVLLPAVPAVRSTPAAVPEDATPGEPAPRLTLPQPGVHPVGAQPAAAARPRRWAWRVAGPVGLAAAAVAAFVLVRAEGDGGAGRGAAAGGVAPVTAGPSRPASGPAAAAVSVPAGVAPAAPVASGRPATVPGTAPAATPGAAATPSPRSPRDLTRAASFVPRVSPSGSAPRDTPPRDTAPRAAAPTPIALGAPTTAWANTAGAPAVALAATPDAPDAGQRAALDSVAALLAADPGRRLVVRYTDPTFARASASWRLAVRVAEYLAAGDVAAGRVALARVPEVRRPGLPPGAEAVEVRVEAP